MLEETTYDADGAGGWTPVSRIHYTIGDDVIAQTTSPYSGGWGTGVTQYLLYDGHGSTRQLANADQSINANYNYDAYGTLLQGASAESNPGVTPKQDTSLLYAGEQFDTSAQQYYLRARYYNQNNGTFNRVDPYAGNTQDPQSLHKYAYVHNNPVNAIDPSGLFICGISGVMMATSIRSILANVQVDMGFALQASIEGALQGLSVGQAIGLWWLSIGIGIAAGLLLKAFAKLIDEVLLPLLRKMLSPVLRFAKRLAGSFARRLAPVGRAIGSVVSKVIRRSGSTLVHPGSSKWPPPQIHPDGFLFGYKTKKTLEVGDLIDRYSFELPDGDTGTYFSPAGTPFEARSLPPEYKNCHLTTYRVKKRFDVDTGLAAPWNGQDGMGIQYKTDMPTNEMTKEYLDIVS